MFMLLYSPLPFSSSFQPNCNGVGQIDGRVPFSAFVLLSLSPRCFPLSSPRLSHILTVSGWGLKGAFLFESASLPAPLPGLVQAATTSSLPGAAGLTMEVRGSYRRDKLLLQLQPSAPCAAVSPSLRASYLPANLKYHPS